jgi:hypothetical protein
MENSARKNESIGGTFLFNLVNDIKISKDNIPSQNALKRAKELLKQNSDEKLAHEKLADEKLAIAWARTAIEWEEEFDNSTIKNLLPNVGRQIDFYM